MKRFVILIKINKGIITIFFSKRYKITSIALNNFVIRIFPATMIGKNYPNCIIR